MSKKILYLWLVLFCSCVVSREKYAASLREAELAKGRLTDAKRNAQKEKEQLKAQLDKAIKEKEELLKQSQDCKKSKDDFEAATTKMGEVTSLFATKITELEKSVNLWSGLVYGYLPPSNDIADFATSTVLPVIDPDTKKPNLIVSKTGVSLSAEGSAQIKKIAEELKKSEQKILILGFADGTSDDLKTSSDFALVVTKALIAAGIDSNRLRVSFFGATQGPCNDKGKCQISRVQIALLTKG
jgi:outer membrane protein OmpA-like peptidoglycan-associated protein